MDLAVLLQLVREARERGMSLIDGYRFICWHELISRAKIPSHPPGA